MTILNDNLRLRNIMNALESCYARCYTHNEYENAEFDRSDFMNVY